MPARRTARSTDNKNNTSTTATIRRHVFGRFPSRSSDDDDDEEKEEEESGDQQSGNFSLSSAFSSAALQAMNSDRSLGNGNNGNNYFDTSNEDQNAATVTDKLIEGESQLAGWSRFLVLIVMVCATSAVAYTVYNLSSKSIHDNFQQQFEQVAFQIVKDSEYQTQQILSSLQTLALTIQQQYTQTKNDSFFVTLPYFETLAQSIMNNFNNTITQISFIPIMSLAQKNQWIQYTLKQSQLLHDGDATVVMNEFTQQNQTTNIDNDNDIIHDIYAPFWQQYPTNVDTTFHPTNFNAMELDYFPSLLVHEVLESNQPTLSKLLLQIESTTTAIPNSILLLPIHNLNNTKVVAVLHVQLPWHAFFQPYLYYNENQQNSGRTADMDIATLVLSNTCDQTISYTNRLQYLGMGDLHDNNGDTDLVELGFHTDISSYIRTTRDCWLEIDIYPTLKYQRAITSSTQPVAYTIAVIVVFALTLVVFVIYDIIVERRQGKIIDTAEKSNAIVNSLFPPNVRDRLFNDTTSNIGETSSNASTTKHQSKRDHASDVGSQYSGGNGDPSQVENVGEPDNNGGHYSDNQQSSHHHHHHHHNKNNDGNKPIADLFPECTVLFADIVGFTAWSSTREPSQVFTLLETVYNAFDLIAKRLGVFKVETIGDCYLAVTGLPYPRSDHAVAIVKFAQLCMIKLSQVVQQLETSLGPDTSTLAMRFGLHSGPVTAGVLRGQKSRFQLFGDTVNTASRMESTGKRDHIQVSQDTADLLVLGGKQSWLIPREGGVEAKGKGRLQTYWVNIPNHNHYHHHHGAKELSAIPNSSTDQSEPMSNEVQNERDKNAVDDVSKIPRSSGNPSNIVSNSNITSSMTSDVSNSLRLSMGQNGLPFDKRTERLIEWNVDILLRLLRKIVAMRDVTRPPSPPTRTIITTRTTAANTNLSSIPLPADSTRDTKQQPDLMSLPQQGTVSKAGSVCNLGSDLLVRQQQANGTRVLDEVKEIIELPGKAARYVQDPELVEISSSVKKQLKKYVQTIAAMYPNNPFHSFDHASHVAQSVTKLLGRIVSPESSMLMDFDEEIDDNNRSQPEQNRSDSVTELHNYTYGITSDPITQFACAFSALIHDVDHPGVPNAQLVHEQSPLAIKYENKSIAEQNSVDLAWNLLFEPEFCDLRACIFSTQLEHDRFRSLVVNCVMATDIVDKQLGALRRKRWEKAFHPNDQFESDDDLEEDDAAADTLLDTINRKATIVIEHLIQASDVVHMMQHWHVYIKWNERYFHECYQAYECGRCHKKDPSIGWYKGELGFFDFYIIPLAKKLKECQVFGVSSDEYLNHAMANRREWEAKGRDVVKGYVNKFCTNKNNNDETTETK